MLTIDGSLFEGGGQMLRTAMAMSCIVQKPFRAVKIRAGRKDAGLKAQHVSCGKALERICNAKHSGLYIGSEELAFYPGKPVGGILNIDIGTAGSITLLLQCIALPCLFAEKRTIIKVTGGTDVKWSLSSDYFQHILLPYYQRFAKAEYSIEKRGFYPEGNGTASLKVVPEFSVSDFFSIYELRKFFSGKKLDIKELGNLFSINISSVASALLQAEKSAEIQSESARMVLSRHKVPVNVSFSYAPSSCQGSVVFCEAIFSKNSTDFEAPIRIGSDAYGEKNSSAEAVGRAAAAKLNDEISQGVLDTHLSDNLIPFLALTGGSIIAKPTLHAKANAYVCEQFLGGKFVFAEKEISYTDI